jgi:hypothetical protein
MAMKALVGQGQLDPDLRTAMRPIVISPVGPRRTRSLTKSLPQPGAARAPSATSSPERVQELRHLE